MTEVEPIQLPALCIGIPYRGQLEARGGVGGPYTWQARSTLPDGLDLVPNSGEIRGVPTTAGTFSVEAVDAGGGVSAPREFEIARRNSCSFAYLSSESGSTRLHFRDVFLSSQTNVVLPAETGGGEAVDFEFSPDGAWIALRISSGGTQRLVVYPTRRDEALALAADAIPVPLCPLNETNCSVRDYEWSPNGEYLAVVLSGAAPGQDSLTGIRAALPTEPWPRLGTAAWDFGPVPLDYRGQLAWVGSRWVGFMGADPGSQNPLSEALYTAGVAEDGESFIDLWVANALSATSGRLLATARGLVLTNAEGGDLRFFERLGAYGNADTVRHVGGVLSPSGRLVVSTDAQGVVRVSALELEGEPVFTSEAQTCSELVAWAYRVEPEGTERFACRQEGTLKVFDYATTLELVKQVPFDAPLAGLRRAFSASGRWLVLVEPRRVSLLDLSRKDDAFDTIRSSCCTTVQLTAARDALALADERLLSEYPLAPFGVERAYVLSGARPSGAPCEEDYLRDPARWCGSPHVDNQLKYSRGGENLLFEWPSGTLSLADTSMFSLQVESTASQVSSRLAPCAGCTRNAYAFGP